MAKRSRLYFVSDLHGSGKCFRKFLNGGPIYHADVMVLGGDLAGKAIQAITRTPRGRFEFSFRGASYDLEDGEELRAVEQLIADHGYYPYREEPGELTGMPLGRSRSSASASHCRRRSVIRWTNRSSSLPVACISASSPGSAR